MRHLCFILLLHLFPAIMMAQEENTDTMSFQTLTNLANANYQAYELDKALKYAELALIKSEEAYGKSDSNYVGALLTLGLVHDSKGDRKKSKHLYEEGVRLCKENNLTTHVHYISLMESLAYWYRYANDLTLAELYFLEAKKLVEQTVGKKHWYYAYELNGLASVYYEMGLYDESESLYKEAIELYAETKGTASGEYATALNNLAVCYNAAQRDEDALVYYNKALKIYKKLGGEMDFSYINTLYNISATHQKLEDYETAEELGKLVVDKYRELLGEQHPRYALVVGGLAAIYTQIDDPERALPLYNEALEIYFDINPNHPSITTTLNNMSKLFLMQDQLDSALHYNLWSMRANGIDNFNREQLDDFINDLPDLYFNSFVRATFSLEKFGQILLAYYQKTNDDIWLKRYLVFSEAAVEMVNNIRESGMKEADQLNIINENIRFVAMGLDAAARLYGKDVNYKENIFNLLEQNKSVLLADALHAQQQSSLGNLPDTIYQKEKAFKEQLLTLQQRKIESGISDSIKNELQSKINQISLSYKDFQKKLAEEYPRYHKLKYVNELTSVETIQQSLDAETMLIEYFVADTLLYIFTITKDQSSFYNVPISQKELTSQIKALHHAISDYDYITKDPMGVAYEEYTKYASDLYQTLIAIPLNGQEKIKRLIIIPDNELGHIPFEVLLSEKPDLGAESSYRELEYLQNKYTISYNYSATLIRQNEQRQASKHNKQILAMASSYSGTTNEDAKNRSLRLRNLRAVLEDLPNTSKEVDLLSTYFKGTFLKAKDASESNFKELASNYAVIHLAMHGILDQQAPMRSSLVFTETEDSLSDGFLHAFEITALALKADLAVLSACETGYGKFQQGEGVMSLARSFMYAGVPALVVSLWQVNDQSTSLIMQNFYENLAKGMDKAEALQQAKLSYIEQVENPLAAHPAFWSPFVLIGDESPVKLQKKNDAGWTSWVIGGSVGVLALLGLGLSRRRGKEAI